MQLITIFFKKKQYALLHINHVFGGAWQAMGMLSLLKHTGWTKRSGDVNVPWTLNTEGYYTGLGVGEKGIMLMLFEQLVSIARNKLKQILAEYRSMKIWILSRKYDKDKVKLLNTGRIYPGQDLTFTAKIMCLMLWKLGWTYCARNWEHEIACSGFPMSKYHYASTKAGSDVQWPEPMNKNGMHKYPTWGQQLNILNGVCNMMHSKITNKPISAERATLKMINITMYLLNQSKVVKQTV